MKEEPIKLPAYVKVVFLLIGVFLLTTILSIAQDIIVPFIFASIIAIAISPVVDFMERKKINRTIAITLVLLAIIVLFSGVIALLATRMGLLSDALPELTKKFQFLIKETTAWVSDALHVSTWKINAWFSDSQDAMLKGSNVAIGSTLTTMSGILSAIFLTPVYIFMLLYYQSHLVEFTHKIFGTDNNIRINEMLSGTKAIIQNYLTGLGIQFVILAALNSLGLLLIGIEYAILLGVLGALLNLIPYIGGMVGVVVIMVIALVTKTPIYVVYVAVMYTVIQFIDNNIIVPYIIGSKVKLNGLFSFLAVIAGAALWGIAGMFLSIPLMAIVKLICDRIEPLKPYGFLLGDRETVSVKKKPAFSIRRFVQRFRSGKG